ncbi:Stp1/IreP family PP2C-type Ser/Thr phosphatase, partial [bacterium]|nr:Stp1/IreP family PP2C-type Ser/Thr phosphatase [bacterium]
MARDKKGYPRRIGGKTDVGATREENQDSIDYIQTPDGEWTLLVVCDGMGGHADGKLASSMAVDLIGRRFTELSAAGDAREALRGAIVDANAAVYSASRESGQARGMGTTCAALAVRGDEAWIAHVGDSRVYRIRPGVVERMTRDHSAVQRMVDAGMITEDEARRHPESNVLIRSVGVRETVEPDVRGPEKILPGDRFLLCSDGLWNVVEDEVVAAMASMYEPQEAVEKLIALANDRGGPDNISVQIFERADGKGLAKDFEPKKFRRAPKAAKGPRVTQPVAAAVSVSGGAAAPRGGWRRVLRSRGAIYFAAGLLAGIVVALVVFGFVVSNSGKSAPQTQPAPATPQAQPAQATTGDGSGGGGATAPVPATSGEGSAAANPAGTTPPSSKMTEPNNAKRQNDGAKSQGAGAAAKPSAAPKDAAPKGGTTPKREGSHS